MQPSAVSPDFSLKLVAKSAFLVMSRAIGFGLLGLVLNVAFLIAARHEIGAALDLGHAGHAGAGAVILLVLLLIRPVIVLALLLLLLPIAWFVLGQKHGVACAVHYAFSRNRAFLWQLLLEKFQAFVESRKLLTEGPVATQVPPLLARYFRTLDNLPKVLRWIARRYLEKVNLIRVAEEVAQRPDVKTMTLGHFMSAMAATVAAEPSEDEGEPSLLWVWILLGVNISLFVGIKLF